MLTNWLTRLAGLRRNFIRDFSARATKPRDVRRRGRSALRAFDRADRPLVEAMEARLMMDSTVVFSEIMYNPAGNAGDQSLEFVELHNQLAVNMDLSNWRLDGGIDYVIPAGTILPAGGFLVIAKSPTNLEALTGLIGTLGPYDGQLSNDAEQIKLVNNSGRVMDEVNYNDAGDWPVGPDGGGPSLSRIRPGTTSDDGANWAPSTLVGGSPGGVNFLSGPQIGPSSTLVALDAAWKYLDDDIAPAADWKTQAYVDAAWSEGQGYFFANTTQAPGALTTAINPAASTVYFRTTFNYTGNPAAAQLSLNFALDDGMVVYLNGQEVLRQRMPAGAITHTTAATDHAPNHALSGPMMIPAGALMIGENVLAVEIHQAPVFVTPPPAGITVSGGGLVAAQQGGTFAGSNLAAASGGAVPFALDELGLGIHLISRINDGIYGNTNSWIGNGATGTSGPFVGVRLGNTPTMISSIAFGRDNGGEVTIFTDRSVGNYTLQYTTVAGASAATTDANWTTIGTINYASVGGSSFVPYLRHRFNFTPVNATAVRLIVPSSGIGGGTAIDELEVYAATGAVIPFGGILSLVQTGGDNGSGGVPSNLALASNGATAFALDELGLGTHFITRLNDGVYGNGNSWIGNGATGTSGPFVGVRFTSAQTINRIAFGRDNGGEAQVFTDRVIGTYTLQYTTVASPSAATPDASWTTIDSLAYSAATPNAHLRHVYEFAAVSGVTGFRIKVPSTGISTGTAIDEIEAYGPEGADLLFGARLDGAEILNSGPTLRFSEVSGTLDASFFVELENHGAQPIETGGLKLVGSGGQVFTLPAGTLAPGALMVVTAVDLGYTPLNNARIFLHTAAGTQQLDAVRVHETARALHSDGQMLRPSGPTPGAANTFSLHDEIVINEINYHPRELQATPATTQSEVVVSLGSDWKYNDQGVDLGTAWRNPAFNDAGWAQGPGLLGFNVSGSPEPLRTMLAQGRPTYYFRQSFNVAGPLDGDLSLLLSGIIDDGAVYYLNGQEIHRTNMPPGPIGFNTPASSSVAQLQQGLSLSLPASALLEGTNVLAVEVHQAVNATASGGPTLTPQPGFAISWDGNEGEFFSASNPAFAPDNLARATHGVTAFGTGALVSPHTIAGVNDGQYGNTSSWISAASATPYIGLNFGQLTSIHSIAWGRDNGNVAGDCCGGNLTDRSLGTYTLQYTTVAVPGTGTAETGNAATGWQTIATVGYSGGQFTEYLRHRYEVSQGGSNILATGLRIRVSDAGTAIDEIEVYSTPPAQDLAFAAQMSVVKTLSPAEPYRSSPAEWIELFNRSGAAVDLSGWKLDKGVDFEFPPGTTLGAGEHLVLAEDALYLQTLYPSLSIAGQYSGNLSGGGERLRLLDATGNPADVVDFRDSGRWHEAADGGGSSLELRDPYADNNSPEAWAASDETDQGVWETITYRGVMATDGSTEQYREFIFGLLDSGKVLLDDIRVTENPDGVPVQMIQNGTFTADAFGSSPATWRILGNHKGIVVADPDNPSNKVLRLTATGAAEDRLNHGETTFVGNAPAVNGRTYEVSFRVRWLEGSNQLNSRFYFNRMPRTTLLATPEKGGTPGEANSRLAANIGPTYSEMLHSPAVPAALQAVTVRIRAKDPQSVTSMTLFYSAGGGATQNVIMTLGADGFYRGTIPGQSASTVVQFYVQGQDGSGAISFFPAAGGNSRALYKVQDGLATTGAAHNFRIIMTGADTTLLHTNTNLLSNDLLGATVIYNESEIYYNVGVRLRGSNAGRGDSNHLGYSVRFDPLQLFQGVHATVTLDRSGRGSTAPLSQDEILIKHMINQAGGIAGMYDDLVRVITPNPAHTRTALLVMASYDDEFLETQYENGGDGTLFKLDIAYVPSGTVGGNPEGLKLPNPYFHPASKDLADYGPDKEAYRQHLSIGNNRSEDDYSTIVALSRAMSLTGAELRAATDALIDVDQWMRTFAMQSLAGAADTYTRGGLHHNIQFYVRPEDGKVLAMPWDWDFAFTNSTSDALVGANSNTSKLIKLPGNLRLFHGHLQDLINTTYNTAYMSQWVTHYGAVAGQNFSGITGYIGARASFVLSQLPAFIPFAISTNGGADFSTPDAAVSLGGMGWINVRNIRLAGSTENLDVTWVNDSTWQLSLPIDFGANPITLEAYDFQGNLITTDTITVTSTLENRPQRQYLRITEIHYHPADATLAEIAVVGANDDDFEFVELINTGPEILDLTGAYFASGINFDFTGSAAAVLNPGQRVLIVSDLAAFEARYGTGHNVAGQYGGNLSNGGETLDLVDSFGGLIQSIAFDDVAPWASAADGPGPSLQLIRSDMDGAVVENWTASRPTPGGALGDFEPDGDIDADDIDALMAARGTLDGKFDLNAQRDMLGALTTVVNAEDVDLLILVILRSFYGDANLDRRVSIGDLTILAENFGLTGGQGWADGDFNGDGNVSIGDLTILAEHFGEGEAALIGEGFLADEADAAPQDTPAGWLDQAAAGKGGDEDEEDADPILDILADLGGELR